MKRTAACLILAAAATSAQSDHKVADHKTTLADVDRMMTELSNWGRWGKDDQLGTLNLITPAKRKQAVALVKEGFPISLAHPAVTEKAADAPTPFVRTMILPRPGTQAGYVLENFNVSYHGLAQTHMDALCHAFYQGKSFNGFAVADVTANGCPKLSILNEQTGIMTRGVLMDIAKLKGVEYIDPGTPIYPEDLEAWEKQAGVKVSAGDAIFIRTGRWALRAQKGPPQDYAGLHVSCVKWLRDRGVSILASDVAQDVEPSQVDGLRLPVHQVVLVALGIHIFDNCDLERLSVEAAKRKRWEFLLTAAPLAVAGGTGSPINPIATF